MGNLGGDARDPLTHLPRQLDNRLFIQLLASSSTPERKSPCIPLLSSNHETCRFLRPFLLKILSFEFACKRLQDALNFSSASSSVAVSVGSSDGCPAYTYAGAAVLVVSAPTAHSHATNCRLVVFRSDATNPAIFVLTAALGPAIASQLNAADLGESSFSLRSSDDASRSPLHRLLC